MKVKVNIQYLDLLNLLRQLPLRELDRLKQDISSIRRNSSVPRVRISSLRGKVTKQSEREIDTQLLNLRNEWNDTFSCTAR
ncbi:MAG: hypothetical protein AAGI23_15910 [Bacteroidota bacterium]